MLRADESCLFDFMAAQAKDFSETKALSWDGFAGNPAPLAAVFYFLSQQRWNPSAPAFLQMAHRLDPQVVDSFHQSFVSTGLQPARLSDMTRMRFHQL